VEPPISSKLQQLSNLLFTIHTKYPLSSNQSAIKYKQHMRVFDVSPEQFSQGNPLYAPSQEQTNNNNHIKPKTTVNSIKQNQHKV
jgi:hypothetical protein